MGFYLDLVHQVIGKLAMRNGGTGNDRAWANAVIKPCVNRTGSTLVRGSVVELLTGVAYSGTRVVLASDESTALLGVVVGRYEADGVTFVDADAPNLGTVAVMTHGTCRVLIDSAVTNGEYAYASATPGKAKSLAISKPGAFGTFQESGTSGAAFMVVSHTTINWSFGLDSDISDSLFGDVASAGSTDKVADAGHVHGREPDVSVVDPGVATIVDSTGNGGLGGTQLAEYAIDGDDATFHGSAGTMPSDTIHITINLGASFPIAAWRMLMGGGLAGNMPTTYSVESSPDGTTWTTEVASHAHAAVPGSAASDETVKLPSVVNAQYWRFTNVTGGTDHWKINTLDLLAHAFQPGGGGGGTVVANQARKLVLPGDYTTTSSTFVDVDATNLGITLTTGAHACLVGFMGTTSVNATNNLSFDVDIDGTRQGQTFGLVIAQNQNGPNIHCSFVYMTAALSAGSHTFKLQWKVDGNTGKLFASASVTPAHFWVMELQA